jgi:hypothetical protein
MLTAVACDEIDELTEFDITDDITETFTISVSEDSEDMPQSFTESITIDLASNQDIQDNISLIEDVMLNSLTYEISNFDGMEGTTVTEASINFSGIMVSVADIDLQQSDLDNTVYTLADSSLLNDIAAILQNNTSITATMTGTVDSSPVTFDVIVTLDVTVTVDAF